tara:strand:- start:442 stop:1473 length:1032 start_codon:yes stop_codon:yes gene_type:complete
MGTPKKHLSASRIKTLKGCSWKYYCSYVLKLPEAGNAGADRGTTCHAVLECLVNKKHSKHLRRIVKNQTITSSKAVTRMVKTYLRKFKLLDDPEEDHFELCDQMILVGLNEDFLGKGGSHPIAETDFKLENDDYSILGFIDKTVFYKRGTQAIITDYKTSKRKFEGEDLNNNVQAKSYVLAAKKIWPKLKSVKVRFLFLKFPDDPEIVMEFSEDELNEFEKILPKYYKQINNFDYQEATANFAADQGYPRRDEGFCKNLQCGRAERPGQLKKDGSVMWHCAFKFPFEYYVVKNEKGEPVKSYLDLQEIKNLPDNYDVGVFEYKGCPKFKREKKEEKSLDDFLE